MVLFSFWFFFVCSVCIPNLLNQVHADPAADDRDALFAFKEATNIAYSLACMNSEWDATDPNACSWDHVTCDSDKRVEKIILGGCNDITGHLVPELGKLDKLISLNLYDNRLSGVIPPEFGNLTNLKQLALFNNSLEGQIPKELANLKHLKFILLQDNNLSGAVPDKLANNFPTMNSVNLTNNKGLTGPCTGYACCVTDEYGTNYCN